MRRLVLGALAVAACAHGTSAPAGAAASLPPLAAARPAPDVSWEEAQAALLAGRIAEAGHLFGAFAEAFPEDGRARIARIEQAWAALATDPDAARATEHAALLLERAAPDGGATEELTELRAALDARRRLRDEIAARTADLAACHKALQPVADIERDRAAAKAASARLAQELARKQRELEEVKRRLLEIQQLAAEMLGVPKPPAAPHPDGGAAAQ